MALQQQFYRVAKRTVDALPSWLFRARAYSVYSIALQEIELPSGSIQDDASWEFRWLATEAERVAVEPLVDADNLRQWNTETHRAAVAWRTATNGEQAEPIGVAWFSFEKFEERQLGLQVELQHSEAWLHSAAVLPQWRRRGVYRSLLRFALHSLRDEARERLLLGVSVGNQASLQSHLSVGAQPIGQVTVLRSLGLSIGTTHGNVTSLSGSNQLLGRRVHLTVQA